MTDGAGCIVVLVQYRCFTVLYCDRANLKFKSLCCARMASYRYTRVSVGWAGLGWGMRYES